MMNWTCLVYGGPMTGAMLWWFISARKWFKGPRVNIEHHAIRGDGIAELPGDGSSDDNRDDADKKAARLA